VEPVLPPFTNTSLSVLHLSSPVTPSRTLPNCVRYAVRLSTHLAAIYITGDDELAMNFSEDQYKILESVQHEASHESLVWLTLVRLGWRVSGV